MNLLKNYIFKFRGMRGKCRIDKNKVLFVGMLGTKLGSIAVVNSSK